MDEFAPSQFAVVRVSSSAGEDRLRGLTRLSHTHRLALASVLTCNLSSTSCCFILSSGCPADRRRHQSLRIRRRSFLRCTFNLLSRDALRVAPSQASPHGLQVHKRYAARGLQPLQCRCLHRSWLHQTRQKTEALRTMWAGQILRF